MRSSRIISLFLELMSDEELYRDEDNINDEELVVEILSTIKVNCSVEKCRRVGNGHQKIRWSW